jgi:hypothetical protein
MTAFITRWQAFLILQMWTWGDPPSLQSIQDRGNVDSHCLKTGAKLGYDPQNGWYVSGYHQDGMDVSPILNSVTV